MSETAFTLAVIAVVIFILMGRDDIVKVALLCVIVAGVLMMLTGCATNQTNETYYEPEVYEENYGPYKEECYCKGPPYKQVSSEGM